MKKLLLPLFVIFSVILLVYLILPGPKTIDDFPSLPESTKSTHPGDTWQVPNIAAYFSDNYRDFTLNYYKDSFSSSSTIPFPPMQINYPPEHAYTVIKDQTESTYLEELTYPMRSSLFVNGFEPFDENEEPRYLGATRFDEGGNLYLTKVIIRFYPSPLWARLVLWFGIITSMYMLAKMTERILFDARS